jgi:hypothetical protein
MHKKPYEQVFKEAFTKTLGQRYKESTSSDKISYWVFVAAVIALIIWIFVGAR